MTAMAERALNGCGDATAGEWRERGKGVYHIRRRLTADECQLAGNLTVTDLRNTRAGQTRLAVLFHELPRLKQIADMIGEAA